MSTVRSCMAILLLALAAWQSGLSQSTTQVGTTTHDVQQMCSMGRQVEHRSTAFVNFSWTHQDNTVYPGNRVSYYQAYELTACAIYFSSGGVPVWPSLCGYVDMDVEPSVGFAAIGTIRSDGAIWYPSVFWDFVAGGMPFGIFAPDNPIDIYGWFNNNGTGPSNENLWPKITLQYGTETVLHMVATERSPASASTASSPGTASYYRRVGPYGTGMGVWSLQRIIDTVMHANVVVTASPTTDKVAIAWSAPCDYLRANAGAWNHYENDVWYAISNSQGTDWIDGIGDGSIHESIVGGSHTGGNITNYASNGTWKAYCDLSALITSDDNLHVVWNCRRWDQAPSSQPWMVPGTKVYRRQSGIFHWSEGTGATSSVARATWDMGGNCLAHQWGADAAKMTISECDGKLYVLYTQFGDKSNPCYDVHGTTFVVNGELYLTASDNGGLSWDRPQNLTNTVTHNCTANGCQSEYWASMARYGRIEDCGVYTGDPVLDILYIEDRSAGGAVQPESGIWVTNPVMWMRTICRDVVPEPDPSVMFGPQPPLYDGPFHIIKNGTSGSEIVPLTIENIGTIDLDFNITVDYTDGSGWIQPSTVSGVIPPGPGGAVVIDVEIYAPDGAEDPSEWDATIYVNHTGPGGSEQIPVKNKVGDTHGTISTSAGPSIYDDHLRRMLDIFIPVEKMHSTLLIFTECYGGDKLDDFEGRDKTTVLSATSPGEPAYYRGYHDDAAQALNAWPGYTSDHVHEAGVYGRDHRETPVAQGDPVSLEPTDPSGPIKSRHVLVYAGIPNDLDNADRDAIKVNFQDEGPMTTVTTVGGLGAVDGYDHPGTVMGLMTALQNISMVMSPDEQFIMFVTDHGNLDKSNRAASEGEGSWQSYSYSYPSQVIQAIQNDTGNIPAIMVLAQFDDTLSPTVTIQTSQLTIPNVPFTETIDLDGDGLYYGQYEGWAAIVEVEENDINWENEVIDVYLDDVFPAESFFDVHCITLESGAIARIDEGLDCEPGNANDDGAINLADAVYIINYVFKGGPAPIPQEVCSGDANGDCACNIGDAVYLVDYIFKGGPAPVTVEEWLDTCGWPH